MRPIHLLAVLLFFALLPAAALAADSDGDGVADDADNCSVVANGGQDDADGDGYGNACDGDYNNDGATDEADRAIIQAAVGSQQGDASYVAAADHTASGSVGGADFLAFQRMSGAAPGPSGLACAGSAPCPGS